MSNPHPDQSSMSQPTRSPVSVPRPNCIGEPSGAGDADALPLTLLEQRVFDAVVTYINDRGMSPTIAELALQLRLKSKGTVHRYIQSLIRKQRLVRVGRGWRGLQLVESGTSCGSPTPVSPSTDTNVCDYRPLPPEFSGEYQLPLLGRIAAGRPIEAVADENYLDLTAFFIGPDRYALRVTGDSMVDAGILDGDTVILRKQDTANTGDIVVALIDGQEATLKRLGELCDGMVELIPENSTMQSMRYAAHRVSLQGVLVGQLRSY